MIRSYALDLQVTLTQQVERDATTLTSKRKALAFVFAILLRVDLEKLQTPLMVIIAIATPQTHLFQVIAHQSLTRLHCDLDVP
jgi:hypothetical protein